MALFGFLPFTLAPLNTVLGLLIMQGISMSMWKSFLNQTIPTFNVQRFSQNRPRFAFTLTNNQNEANSQASAPQDQQNAGLLQSLGILQPALVQSAVALPPAATVQQIPLPPVSPQIIVMPNVNTQKSMPAVVQVPMVVQRPATMLTTLVGQASTTIPVQIPPPKSDNINYNERRFAKTLLSRKSLIPPPLKTTTSAFVEGGTNALMVKEKYAQKEENEVHRAPGGHRFKRVCYYILEKNVLKPNDIDPYICTHIVVMMKDGLFKTTISEDDLESLRRFKKLKLLNNDMKIMLSVGTETEDIEFLKNVTAEKSMTFIQNIVGVTNLYQIDGINLHLEFITQSSFTYSEMLDIINLLKKLRSDITEAGKPYFIISATMNTPLVYKNATDGLQQVVNNVDFVNLASYDFHYYSSDRPYTGHHSSLYQRESQTGYFQNLNMIAATKFWLDKIISKEKLLVGVPFFARTYNLAFPFRQGLDAPATSSGIGGGKINYAQVCEFLKHGAISEYDSTAQVPFAYKDYDWIAYENERSVSAKTRWVVKMGFGGIATFTLNDDDWSGSCREDNKTFPLQRQIARTLELASIKLRSQDDEQ